MRTVGDMNAAITDVITEATELYAACYGSQERSDMSAVRFDVWSSKMAYNFFNSALTPITDVFKQHVYGTHFQAALWRAVLDADTPVCMWPSTSWMVA